ncbi:MAG TPA: hypothetical protein DD640_02455 [Clostridiales bacterium]|nr:hypothetical protein [Clostridiales bacterium]
MKNLLMKHRSNAPNQQQPAYIRYTSDPRDRLPGSNKIIGKLDNRSLRSQNFTGKTARRRRRPHSFADRLFRMVIQNRSYRLATAVAACLFLATSIFLVSWSFFPEPDSKLTAGTSGSVATGELTPVPSGPTAAPTAAPADEPVQDYPGIDRSITADWIFPLQVETETPVYGLFGSSRSSRRIHAGIDLYAPTGTPIYAMTAGWVQNIDDFYQGLSEIAIANQDGTTIRYCELIPSVSIGDQVVQGQQIGTLKQNYDGTCMLHLEIYATISSDPLTQTENLSDYLHVPVGKKSYLRRRDLVDPSAVLLTMRSPETGNPADDSIFKQNARRTREPVLFN